MKTTNTKLNLLILFIILNFNAYSQENSITLVNYDHVELNQISDFELLTGYGIELTLNENDEQKFVNYQLQIFVQTDKNELIPLQFKTIASDIHERLGTDKLSLWFSKNWTKNLPKNFLPSGVLETYWNQSDFKKLKVVCYGSSKYEYKSLPSTLTLSEYNNEMANSTSREIVYSQNFNITTSNLTGYCSED